MRFRAKKYVKSTTLSVDNSISGKRNSLKDNYESGKLKLNLAQFYKKDDIIRNKIEKWARKPSDLIHQNINKKRT